MLFLPLALLCLAGSVAYYHFKVEANLVKIRASEAVALKLGSDTMTQAVQSIVGDLQYLASDQELADLVSGLGYVTEGRVGIDWQAFARARGIYDQISWIDLSGFERLRVDFNDGDPVQASKSDLRFRGMDRYFWESLVLGSGDVYFAPFQLDGEPQEGDTSTRPVLRVGTPVYDRGGEKQGVLVLTYRGRGLLTEYTRAVGVSGANAWLTNRRGYWLKGPSPEDEWAFMWGRDKASMPARYPAVWDRILAADKGQFEDAHGLWTFETIYPLADNAANRAVPRPSSSFMRVPVSKQDYLWKAIVFTPAAELRARAHVIGIDLLPVIGLIVIVVGLSAVLLWPVIRTLLDEHRLVELACYDRLTGLLNRHTIDRVLDRELSRAERYSRPLSVILFDLDNFKRVNDQHGHPIGDAVLASVGAACIALCRANDAWARYGGEEFVAVLPETAEAEAAKLAERLRAAFERQPIKTDAGEVALTVSAGVVTWRPALARTSRGKLIAAVDIALYDSKVGGRNRVTTAHLPVADGSPKPSPAAAPAPESATAP